MTAAQVTRYDPLGLALLAAVLFHAFLILGVSFDIDRSSPPAPDLTLDITLVRPQPPKEEPEEVKPPEQPQFLAQETQEGGGEERSTERPTTLPSAPAFEKAPEPTREVETAGAPEPKPEPVREVVTSTKAKPKVEVIPEPEAPPAPAPRIRPDISQILASTQREIDMLTAEMDDRVRRSSDLRRRKSINSSTQEYKYAAYLDAWRKKVEHIGNLNYPDEARKRKLRGQLILHVVVRADGTVEMVRVVNSSGHKVLDDAAVRIVRLAAPFAPFPQNIREEVDVLDITRTWQFLSDEGLFQQN